MFEDWEERMRNFIKGLFGDTQQKRIQMLQPYVDKANTFAEAFKKLTDEELKDKTAEFKKRIEEYVAKAPDEKLIPDDVIKMPGQVRTTKDRALAEILEEILKEEEKTEK